MHKIIAITISLFCLTISYSFATTTGVDLDMNRDGKIDLIYIPDLSSIYQTVIGSGENYFSDAQLAEIEAALSIQNIPGAVTDSQVPNDITIDHATSATTATIANSGDSATAFFSSGTIEDERLPSSLTRDTEAALAYEPKKGANDNFVTDTDITKLSLLPSTIGGAYYFYRANSTGTAFESTETLSGIDLTGLNPLMVAVSDASGTLQSHSDVTVTELLTAANGADAGKGSFESRLTNLETAAGTGRAIVYPGSENNNTIAVTISTGNLANSLIPVWLSDTDGGAATSTAFDGDGGDGWVISDATVFSTTAANISETILTGTDGDAVITLAHSNAASPVTKYLCAEYKGDVECDAITFSPDVVTYERVIDNADAGFSYVGTFYTSTGDPGFYGTNYRYSRVTYGTSATWTFTDVPEDGTYELFVQYPIGDNYDATVRYTIVDSVQTQYTSYFDMNANGGSMRSMGTYTLKAGTVAITLTWSSLYVAADAVKLVAVP